MSACFQLFLTLQWWKRRLIIIIIIKLKTSNESVAFTLPDGALQFDAVQRRIRSWKAAVKLFTVTVDRPKKKKQPTVLLIERKKLIVLKRTKKMGKELKGVSFFFFLSPRSFSRLPFCCWLLLCCNIEKVVAGRWVKKKKLVALFFSLIFLL